MSGYAVWLNIGDSYATYAAMARRRIEGDAGMFAQLEAAE